MKVQVQVTISQRTTSGPSGVSRAVAISIEDSTSHLPIVEVEMPPEVFAEAMFGLSHQKAEAEVYPDFAKHLGKKRITEFRSTHCPLPGFTDRKVLEEWLEKNAQEEGWFVSTYLGARDSVSSYMDGKEGCALSYSVFKFVDAKQGSVIRRRSRPAA